MSVVGQVDEDSVLEDEAEEVLTSEIFRFPKGGSLVAAA